MIVYKCDGETFKNDVHCKNEYVGQCENDTPPNWIKITGSIINNNMDAHLIKANSTFHFCSRACLEYRFFKNENNIL